MDIKSHIDGIQSVASNHIKAEPGDYIADGLLICGKCNTPKQCRKTLFGEVITPYCLCKCEAQRREEEQRRKEEEERQERIKYMRKIAFPESNMSEWTFAKDDQTSKVSKVAHNYVENFAEMRKKGKGLLLYGDVGTGKTFTASCIANALIDREIPCFVTNFPRLVNTITGMYDGKQDYIDGLNRYRLLVIDDLASERDTEYMNEVVWNIIDARYRSQLPLIVTTNLTGQQIKYAEDLSKKRIYSRILEMCIPVEVTGADRRKENLKTNYKEFKELLGL